MSDDQVKIQKQSAGNDALVGCSDGNYYPYGTRLSFDDGMVDDLGVENLAVGDIVELRGFAFVESKSEHSDADRSSKSVSLQLTSLKVRREDGDMAEQLYGPNA